MMRALGLFALAAGLLILPRLSAQEPARDDAHSSHRLDFLSMPEGNLDDLLRQRLAAKQLKGLNPNFKPEDIDKLKEKLQDPAFLKQLENLPPGIRDLLKGMSAEQIKEKLGPEVLDQVKAQLQKQAATGALGDPGSQKPEETPAAQQPAQAGPAPSQQPGQDAAGSEAATEDALANSKMGDLFERFARKVDPKWRDSPAAHRFLQALSERMGEKDERWEQLAKGAASMTDKWADLGRSLHLDRVVTGERANWLAKLLPEKLPARIARRLSDTLPAPGAATPGLGGSASTGSWSWLTTPAAIGLLGLILWLALRALRRQRGCHRQGTSQPRPLACRSGNRVEPGGPHPRVRVSFSAAHRSGCKKLEPSAHCHGAQPPPDGAGPRNRNALRTGATRRARTLSPKTHSIRPAAASALLREPRADEVHQDQCRINDAPVGGE